MTRRTSAALILLAAALLVAGHTQTSAQGYPNRPIRLISPFPAGGGNDVLARIVAAKLADRLKATVVVENRPGAGAVIGISAVAKSPPDGYTLVLSGSTLAVAPTLYKVSRSTRTRTSYQSRWSRNIRFYWWQRRRFPPRTWRT